MSHITCLMSCVRCQMSCVMCHVSCFMFHVSCIMYHVSCVMCHVSGVMCHVSYVISRDRFKLTSTFYTSLFYLKPFDRRKKKEKKWFSRDCFTSPTCHASHFTCHVSHLTCHMSHLIFFFCVQGCETGRWIVCYQRGYHV